MFKRTFAAIIICFLSISPLVANAFKGHDYDRNRASLIAYMLKEHLGIHNFGHKKIDNAFSRNAFKLYLRQLDPQKRFLLKSDVKKLSAYSKKIDDEMQTGMIELPDVAAKILASRILQVEKMIKELLADNFDFTRDEMIETDADKLDFCKTQRELKDRWRKVLRYEVLNHYLVSVDDFKKEASDAQREARGKVAKSYEDLFARMHKEKKSERYDGYLGVIARTFDPHTQYMPPVSKEAYEVSMKGSFEGIGATLREENGYIKVEAILPGSPAFRQGELQPGDIILKVAEGTSDPVDIFDMKIADAIRLIRGKKGTEVRLTVRKQDGTQLVIAIVRDTIQIEETFARSGVIRDETTGQDFGYIKLPIFYGDVNNQNHGGSSRNSTDDVKREIESLESRNIKGLVLDLRHNGGGLLNDAVNIAGLFIGPGPVVQIKSSSGNMSALSNKDSSVQYKGPLVIIVDEMSASASEILAGALQDYGRAVVVGGVHTHGKGTVQRVVDLDNVIPLQNMEKFKPLGALKLTIQKFYRVTGESTQYEGVVPDIILPDRLRCMKIGEKYLDFALPWDKVKPVPFEKWAQQPDLRMLRVKSDERVRSNEDFVNVVKESERVCQQQKKTNHSLNIDAARKERSESGKEARDFHGSLSREKKSGDDTQQKKEDMKNHWVNELKKDPYVQEAVAVLRDSM